MGKVLVAILATMAALWLAFLFIGPQLGTHAFSVPHFGWGVTWTMVLGGCFLYGFYRIAKGK